MLEARLLEAWLESLPFPVATLASSPAGGSCQRKKGWGYVGRSSQAEPSFMRGSFSCSARSWHTGAKGALLDVRSYPVPGAGRSWCLRFLCQGVGAVLEAGALSQCASDLVHNPVHVRRT